MSRGHMYENLNILNKSLQHSQLTLIKENIILNIFFNKQYMSRNDLSNFPKLGYIIISNNII